MGSVGERLTDAAEPLQLPSMRRVPAFCSSPSLRKSVSAPHLPSLDASGMEVYVIQRPFLSFGAAIFKRLPPKVNQLFLDVGVCHYMTVFRTPSGQLVQFDFGPRGGGDISLGPADQSRMARLFRKNRSRAVPAEIREAKLAALPESAFLVGKTNLTLQQIRTFNEAQLLEYEVHKSDCRHYVDRLVRYSTGRERAAAAAAKFVYETRNRHFRWASGLTMCTDAHYYGHLKAMGQASLAMAAMLTNRGKVSRLLTSRVAPTTSRALARVPASPMIQRRVLPTAGAATASVAVAAWAEAPVVRQVLSLGEGMKRAASRGISWMGEMAKAGGGLGSAGKHQVLRLPFRHRQSALSLA